MPYNWQQEDWPAFRYNLQDVEDLLFAFREKTGRVDGLLEGLPKDSRDDTVVDIILAEAVNTSEIEGEFPAREDILSSIRKNLGLQHAPQRFRDRSAEGLGALMVDVRRTCLEPLTEEKLFQWHTLLLGDRKKIRAGAWRSHPEPMQIVSGAIGREKVHFEAPPSARVPREMEGFIRWFNDTAPGAGREIRSAPVRAAVAHLYFETIHPFEDGNGRIGRAIAEKALSQTVGRAVVLSVSKAIETDRNAYYKALQQAQTSLDITEWVAYFVRTVIEAQTDAETVIGFTIKKARFHERFRGRLNPRQSAVIDRMLEEGPKGFDGGMSARKYGTIAKTSKATATRDLQQLLDMGAFLPFGTAAGRSTRYQLNL
jgi:Fic family protein